MTHGFDEAEYAALVHTFPPRRIRDEAQLHATEGRIEELLSLEVRTDAEEEFLDLLANLVHEWESEHAPIPPVGGVEVVRFLLEQRALPDKALTPVLGTRSIVSEVLLASVHSRRSTFKSWLTSLPSRPRASFRLRQKQRLMWPERPSSGVQRGEGGRVVRRRDGASEQWVVGGLHPGEQAVAQVGFHVCDFSGAG